MIPDHRLADLRIRNQHIDTNDFKTPEDVVKNMLAMQAKE